jgi:hypothetical protein
MSKPNSSSQQEISKAIDVFLQLDNPNILFELSKMDLSAKQLSRLARKTHSRVYQTNRNIAANKNLNDEAARILLKRSKATEVRYLLLTNHSLSVGFRKSCLSNELVGLIEFTTNRNTEYVSIYHINSLAKILPPELLEELTTLINNRAIIKDIIE